MTGEGEEVTGGGLSRGELGGTIAVLASAMAALVIAWTGAVSGPWFVLMLAGMLAAVLAVRIIVP